MSWTASALFAQQSILFLGNSLTYSNDMPGMVRDIASSYGIEVDVQSICLPNYALEDHINDGRFQKLLEQKQFDYVVFQQGPSSQRYGRESLIEYGAEIDRISKANGSEAVYFMVWTSLGYYHTFDKVIENHENAAKLNGMKVVPVGKVWFNLRSKSPHLGLYNMDGFHPSPKGSFLAAFMIYSHLFGDIDDKPKYKSSFWKWISKSDFNRMFDVERDENMGE